MVLCPICNRDFTQENVENHVDKCIFLNGEKEALASNSSKRKSFALFNKSPVTVKKSRILASVKTSTIDITQDTKKKDAVHMPSQSETLGNLQTEGQPLIPLAEKMRPCTMDDYVGQEHVLGEDKVLRVLLLKKEIPSMILWGPPGCGKTTLAHVIASQCKLNQSVRFVKLSATMAGVNDVKEIIKVAKNELKFKKKTILFMDEIHRFNKLQQDTFLPHVESGVITLIGATTENPSFSLNNALLSRCRVIVLEKLGIDNIILILQRALQEFNAIIIQPKEQLIKYAKMDNPPKFFVESATITWLAEMCDGDARIALNSLQLVFQSIKLDEGIDMARLVTMEEIKDGIKRSHILYDKKGDQHFDIISALHKSVRASDDNAALYWCMRMLSGGEDPKYVARRLVRIASEDIGLADPQALQMAVATMHSVQLVGMPECDVMLAHCTVYLARASKSREVYDAMLECKDLINNNKGIMPPVPLHLRNAPTKLMKELGYGAGYNLENKEASGLSYMPESMENINFFE